MDCPIDKATLELFRQQPPKHSCTTAFCRGLCVYPELHGFLQDRCFHPQRAWLPPQMGPPRRPLAGLLSGTKRSGVVSTLTNHRGGRRLCLSCWGLLLFPSPFFPTSPHQGISPPVLVPFSPGRLVTRVLMWRDVYGPTRALWGHRVMLRRVCCTA